jgi:hypothetical protein
VAVAVTIDPRTKVGPFAGPTEIETTDPMTPVIRFRVLADAVPPYTLSPDALAFLDVRPGDVPEREFALVTRLDPGADMPPPPRPEPASKAVRCDFRERDVSEGRPDQPRRVTHRYTVRLDVNTWLSESPSENAATVLHFVGVGPAVGSELPIRISRPYHSVVIGQRSVTLHRSQPDVKAPVRFWARDGRPLEIAAVRPSSPQVSAEISAQKSRVLELTVSLAPAAGAEQAGENGHVDVQFTDGSTEPYRVGILVLP